MQFYHEHHIIPRHMGGTDDPENLVKVTVEHHARLHQQLWEDLGHWQDHVAWKMLSGQITRQEAIRLAQSEGAKNRPKKFGKDNHFFGRQHTHESNEKNRQKHLGKQPHNKGVYGEKNLCSKTWEIITPTGNSIIIKGLTEYCRQNGLTYQAMGQVALGRLNHHKQYKCRRII